ncbi:MAG: 16S rRNA (cytosine(1402)-N(4))-methyltransferase RsmH [Planctomycetes bacterium]|nr:16S rRNA (cytosine(1402)-N(4))-methyltransferase RsmH [Planctomycetota bacterium]
MRRFKKRRSTPHGEHRPVLLNEVLETLDPRPGMIVVDCTVGWAGHGAEILSRIGPSGILIGLDMDAENLPKARERLEPIGHPFHLHHSNFAGLQQVLATHGLTRVDAILADLGMSSMQVDDPDRGFSYSRDGALDMRMDRSRGQTAAQLLATISKAELIEHLVDLGDEPDADTIASAIVAARKSQPITTTTALAQIILAATKKKTWRLQPTKGKWETHPAARLFQTLRILVNRELGNLEHLLRILPATLLPGGRAAIISFHSGEDRRVKAAFRQGFETGVYAAVAEHPMRPTLQERTTNPRSRSAKLRWARIP